MFQPGEKIVYGTDGVCEVIEIEEKILPKTGRKQLYYKLKPVFQDYTIYSPVDSGTASIRRVISKAEAENLIYALPAMKFDLPNARLRKDVNQKYQAALDAQDPALLLALTKSVYERRLLNAKTGRSNGTTDDHYMKRAEEMLFGELSVALNVPKEEIPSHIGKLLSRNP